MAVDLGRKLLALARHLLLTTIEIDALDRDLAGVGEQDAGGCDEQRVEHPRQQGVRVAASERPQISGGALLATRAVVPQEDETASIRKDLRPAVALMCGC